MALFSIKEASEQLECSVQNIYNKKPKLTKMGYIEKDPITGQFMLNEQGFNYIKNQRIATEMALNNTLKQNDESVDITIKDELLKSFKQQIEKLENEVRELKAEKKEWEERYIENNKQILPILLSKNKEQQIQDRKTSFWFKLFNKGD